MNPLSNKAKVLAILQLCVVLSYGLWCAGWPFMGEIFAIRSKMLVFEATMGKGDFISRTADPQLLENHQAWFAKLPPEQQAVIQNGFQQLQIELNRPFLKKWSDAFHLFLFDLSPFLLIWFVAGFMIPLWLLKGRAYAYHAMWLLPLIAICYGIDNQFYGEHQSPPSDLVLFPSEEYLVKNYLDEPLDQSIFHQKQQLHSAWNRYLLKEWAPKEEESEKVLVDKGAYQFLAARVTKLSVNPLESFNHHFKERESLTTLLLFLCWNFFLAGMISFQRPKALNYLSC